MQQQRRTSGIKMQQSPSEMARVAYAALIVDVD
jgi:hypothetical protein